MMKPGTKFLIVDDDAFTIEILKRILINGGYQAFAETSPLRAIDLFKKEQPEIVLADIMMPEMDGFELFRALRGAPGGKRMKFIVITAKTYDFDRRRAREMGADGYFTKPILADSLLDDVERIVADRIDMHFWGVRGTLPVPGAKSLKYGGNTSCVTFAFPKGDFFIFDAGSGIKELSNTLMRERRTRIQAKIFISHPHWDHINALPFFVPLYVKGNEFEILGPAHSNKTMRELISAQMDDVYFPVTISEFAARVEFRDLREQDVDLGGDIAMRTMLLSHPGNCLGYRMEYGGRSICYITDNELYLENDRSYNAKFVAGLEAFLGDADVVITDTTYMDDEYPNKIGWGHSSVGQVAGVAHRAAVKNLFLFHHDPDQTDADIDAKHEAMCETLAALGSFTHCVTPVEGSSFKI